MLKKEGCTYTSTVIKVALANKLIELGVAAALPCFYIVRDMKRMIRGNFQKTIIECLELILTTNPEGG